MIVTKALDMKHRFAIFNGLTWNEKWCNYKDLENVEWVCHNCKTVLSDGPMRDSFGSERRCENCDALLTGADEVIGGRRFGWVAREERLKLSTFVKEFKL